MPTFLTYKRFHTDGDAAELIRILEENHIEHFVDGSTPSVTDAIMGQNLNANVLVQIQQRDFERVRKLMHEIAQKQIQNVDPNYHLFSFSNDELFEIVEDEFSWSEFDVELAKKILNDRGVKREDMYFDSRSVTKEEKDDNPFQVVTPNRRKYPIPLSPFWIVFGYTFALLGGLPGIMMGLFVWIGYKTFPDGKRIYFYDANARAQGMAMTILGTIVFVAFFLFNIWQNMFLFSNY